MQVVVDGLMTSYERHGAGQLVLILPGWADTAANWQKFIGKLAETYEVITLDLPGFGASEPPESTWGLDDYAKFVAAFLKKIDAAPSAIVGHSNGGAIAVRGVGEELLKPRKLVLLASAGLRNQYKGRTKALRLVTKTGKALTAPLPKGVKRQLRRKVYQTVGSDMLVAEHMQETFKKIVSEDVQADAAKIDVPTLLVYGENDEATPVRYGEILHQTINGSTLEILPGAGHFLYLDRQQAVLDATKGFLQ